MLATRLINPRHWLLSLSNVHVSPGYQDIVTPADQPEALATLSCSSTVHASPGHQDVATSGWKVTLA